MQKRVTLMAGSIMIARSFASKSSPVNTPKQRCSRYLGFRQCLPACIILECRTGSSARQIWKAGSTKIRRMTLLHDERDMNQHSPRLHGSELFHEIRSCSVDFSDAVDETDIALPSWTTHPCT